MKGREKRRNGVSVSERSVEVCGREVRWVSGKSRRESMNRERGKGRNEGGGGASMRETSVKV